MEKVILFQKKLIKYKNWIKQYLIFFQPTFRFFPSLNLSNGWELTLQVDSFDIGCWRNESSYEKSEQLIWLVIHYLYSLLELGFICTEKCQNMQIWLIFFENMHFKLKKGRNMHFSCFYCIFKDQFWVKKVPKYAKHAKKSLL
jgi:hypothetical protein